ncbi:MAG: hypothetical protein GX640_02125 [Fibrobacter sp.]|nr:hypothetical protein [Fibrobacter sp.]
MNKYSETASFYRTALLLGLLPGKKVIEWAEGVIASDSDIPQPFYDLVMIPSWDITSLRYALLEICSEAVSSEVLNAILSLVYNDFNTKKRSFNDTMTVLHQIRQFIKTESSLSEKLIAFECEYEEAKHNGTIDLFQMKINDWLGQFSSSKIIVL